MWTNDDMWHIILIGFLEVTKSPSESCQVVAALSFVLNPDKEKGSLISWFYISDRHIAPAKWVLPPGKRNKAKMQHEYFKAQNIFWHCGILERPSFASTVCNA
jgi:hypothetical protein